MTPNQATVDFLRGKTSAPSELRTAEWDLVAAGIRERSFFMAGVEDAEILDRFRSEVDAIAAGEKSESESMADLGDWLEARGYEPLPGQEGTIKDLRTAARQRVALRTNVEAARSYGQWVRQQQVLGAFPAWQYLRGREAEVPRDWPAMWNAARAATTEAGATLATDEDSMYALVNHPLFLNPDFNRFGTPYTPFQFGSGMLVSGVSRSRAVSLGLLPSVEDDPEGHALTREMLTPRERSFNETLEVRPAVASQPIRAMLADRLQGLAEWDGEVLRFTDPNGTRRGTPEEVARWISRPLPEVFHTDAHPEGLRQKDALVQYFSDSDWFRRRQSRDAWSDLQRLFARIINPANPPLLLRGMRMGRARLDEFLSTIKKSGYAVRRNEQMTQWVMPGDSWTENPRAARRYARLDEEPRRDRWSVILRVEGEQVGESFAGIGPLVQALQSESRKKIVPPVASEAEWVLRIGHLLRVRKVREDRNSRTVTIDLTPAGKASIDFPVRPPSR